MKYGHDSIYAGHEIHGGRKRCHTVEMQRGRRVVLDLNEIGFYARQRRQSPTVDPADKIWTQDYSISKIIDLYCNTSHFSIEISNGDAVTSFYPANSTYSCERISPLGKEENCERKKQLIGKVDEL